MFKGKYLKIKFKPFQNNNVTCLKWRKVLSFFDRGGTKNQRNKRHSNFNNCMLILKTTWFHSAGYKQLFAIYLSIEHSIFSCVFIYFSRHSEYKWHTTRVWLIKTSCRSCRSICRVNPGTHVQNKADNGLLESWVLYFIFCPKGRRCPFTKMKFSHIQFLRPLCGVLTGIRALFAMPHVVSQAPSWIKKKTRTYNKICSVSDSDLSHIRTSTR